MHQFSFIHSFIEAEEQRAKACHVTMEADDTAHVNEHLVAVTVSACYSSVRAAVCWFVCWRTKCCDVLKSACYFG